MTTYIHLVMRTHLVSEDTDVSRSYSNKDDAYRMADYLNSLSPRHYNFWVHESVTHDSRQIGRDTVI